MQGRVEVIQTAQMDGHTEMPETPNTAEIHDWDITRGPRKEGALNRLGMVVPAATRVVTGFAGATLATTGYVAGKLGEAVGAGKAVDSTAFRVGCKTFLWSNGIFSNVEFEPLGETGAQLSRLHGLVQEPSPDDMTTAPVIVSNHTSYLDGLVLAVLFGAPKIVAMSGARNTPVFGKVMEEMDVVFVNRQDRDSRRAALNAISGHCSTWTPGSRPLLIFPEGTVSNGEGVLPFKKGAFVSGTPVRPVVMVYTGHFDPACTSYKMSEEGPVETTDEEWVKQIMGHFVHSVHVRVLPPYLPTKEERANPDFFADNCHALMERELMRVRAELQQCSWKEASGRTDGGLSYRFGDVTRTVFRNLHSGCLGRLR